MTYNTVTVSNVATLILAPNTARLSLLLVNASTDTTIYIGQDTSVTTTNGVPIYPESNLTEDSGGTKMYCGPIYGIVSTGTADCRYWERQR